MMTRSMVTFDLDSTICDTQHRHGMITGPDTDWVLYSMACGADEPVLPVIEMARALSRHHDIIYISARRIEALPHTIEWMGRHDLPLGQVFLDDSQPGQPHESHLEYKLRRIRQVEGIYRGRVLFHVDDYPPVAAYLRDAGIHCVIVTPPQVLARFKEDGIVKSHV